MALEQSQLITAMTAVKVLSKMVTFIDLNNCEIHYNCFLPGKCHICSKLWQLLLAWEHSELFTAVTAVKTVSGLLTATAFYICGSCYKLWLPGNCHSCWHLQQLWYLCLAWNRHNCLELWKILKLWLTC